MAEIGVAAIGRVRQQQAGLGDARGELVVFARRGERLALVDNGNLERLARSAVGIL